MENTRGAALQRCLARLDIPGTIEASHEGWTLVKPDGAHIFLGRTAKEAEQRLGCQQDPHSCWGMPAGTLGDTVEELNGFAVDQAVVVTRSAKDDEGNVARQGDVGTITQILSRCPYPYFVDFPTGTGLWLALDEIAPAP